MQECIEAFSGSRITKQMSVYRSLEEDGYRRTGPKVEQETALLDLVQPTERDYFAASISRSSISNTNVAPGLIRGGKPLSR